MCVCVCGYNAHQWLYQTMYLLFGISIFTLSCWNVMQHLFIDRSPECIELSDKQQRQQTAFRILHIAVWCEIHDDYNGGGYQRLLILSFRNGNFAIFMNDELSLTKITYVGHSENLDRTNNQFYWSALISIYRFGKNSIQSAQCISSVEATFRFDLCVSSVIVDRNARHASSNPES